MHKENNNPNPLIIEMEANLIGNDYVIGDLHGCYDELMALLKHVNFNKEKDRLFCTGDLVHRGPKSKKCLELLKSKNKQNKQWFFSTFGNHDEFYEQDISNDNPLDSHKYTLEEFKDEINHLPYIYIVNHLVYDKFYIMHGEFDYSMISDVKEQESDGQQMYFVLNNDLTEDIIEILNDKNLYLNDEQKRNLIWDRKLFKYFNNFYKIDISMSDFSFLNKFKRNEKLKIFCGHNVVPFPMKMGHQYYLDTGACFGYYDNKKNQKVFSKWGCRFFGLTIIDINSGSAHICVSSEYPVKLEGKKEVKRGDILTLSKPLYKAFVNY